MPSLRVTEASPVGIDRYATGVSDEGTTEGIDVIPPTSREDLVRALERFDAELRNSSEWRDWTSNANHKYAIRHGERLFPVKQVISLATGAPVSSFSGGEEANSFVQGLGFQVEPLRHSFSGLRDLFGRILEEYNAPDRGSISKDHPVWKLFGEVGELLRGSPPVAPRERLRVQPSVGQGNWAKVPWIALMDERETTSTQHGVYVVYLFREDMSGLYVTFNQGVTELYSQDASRAKQLLRERAEQYRAHTHQLREHGFLLDNTIDLHTTAALGRRYETSTIAHKFYGREALPPDDELVLDLEAVLVSYGRYLEQRRVQPAKPDHGQQVEQIADWVRSRGYFFEPWQIATYMAAAKTKSFVILAGVSGSGKSKLPELIGTATGATTELIPVRPEWTDSSELLGYRDLRGTFRAGPLLKLARAAGADPTSYNVCVIDEMNLARVEYYFAEVLSRMEDDPSLVGQRPLLSGTTEGGDQSSEWSSVALPQNLLLVGTVNMDETTHGFSKKVLDRAFTIEFSRVFLSEWQPSELAPSEPLSLDSAWWQPRGRRLSDIADLTDRDRSLISSAVTALETANDALQRGQLQIGYRVRDELALFLLHADPFRDVFVDAEGDPVDPLDIGLTMKLLPRISGGSNLIRDVLRQLLGWAGAGDPKSDEMKVAALVDRWQDAGSGDVLPDAPFPRTAGRLCLMWSRLEGEGFTSYWL